MSQIPPAAPVNYSQPPQKKSPGLSIASMILGIVSIPVCCVWFLSIVCGLLGIILGVIARGKISRGEASGGGMAITGIVCGIIGLLFGLGIFSLGHFGGPAAQRWLDKLRLQTQQKIEEEQRKQQEREKQGSATQETLLQQELRARNLAIVLD